MYLLDFCHDLFYNKSIVWIVWYGLMDLREEFKKATGKEYVYNMCHFDNLLSIMRNGILCNNDMRGVPHRSIANNSVQQRRENKVVPNGLKLHLYANCYLNPRNAMLYVKKQEINIENLIILGISTDILNIGGVVLSDRNAATDAAAFYPPDLAMSKLNFKNIYVKYWNSSNYTQKQLLKNMSQAEVLVPHKIDVKYIKKIYVVNNNVKRKCEETLGKDIPIEVNKYMFFEGDNA